jgi:hypothetical protein
MSKTKDVILGGRYRDTVSGWEGTATGRYEYMNGCLRIELSATGKDGEPKSFVFDVQQLEPVKEAKVMVGEKPARTGGPRDSTPLGR